MCHQLAKGPGIQKLPQCSGITAPQRPTLAPALALHVGNDSSLSGLPCLHSLPLPRLPFPPNREEGKKKKKCFSFHRASYPQNDLSGLVIHLWEIFTALTILPLSRWCQSMGQGGHMAWGWIAGDMLIHDPLASSSSPLQASPWALTLVLHCLSHLSFLTPERSMQEQPKPLLGWERS